MTPFNLSREKETKYSVTIHSTLHIRLLWNFASNAEISAVFLYYFRYCNSYIYINFTRLSREALASLLLVAYSWSALICNICAAPKCCGKHFTIQQCLQTGWQLKKKKKTNVWTEKNNIVEVGQWNIFNYFRNRKWNEKKNQMQAFSLTLKLWIAAQYFLDIVDFLSYIRSAVEWTLFLRF